MTGTGRSTMIDLTNQQFGRLTARWPVGKTNQGQTLWLCSCDCGCLIVARIGNLRYGTTKSCGCLQAEIAQRTWRAVQTRHGMTGTPEFSSFCHARRRCADPKDAKYADYGGRGIEFRFSLFEEFMKEVGPRPSRSYSLDRKDVNGHYEPGNVRWATREEQASNRRDRGEKQNPERALSIAEYKLEQAKRRVASLERTIAGMKAQPSL